MNIINQLNLVSLATRRVATGGGSVSACYTYDSAADLFGIIAPVIHDDGSNQVRKVVRDGSFCVDITITGTGFSGSEGTDWKNLIEHTGQTSNYRYGFRDNQYVVDCGITGTGFAGTEGVDWENVFAVSHPSGDNVFRDCVDSGAYKIEEEVSTVWTTLEEHS